MLAVLIHLDWIIISSAYQNKSITDSKIIYAVMFKRKFLIFKIVESSTFLQ